MDAESELNLYKHVEFLPPAKAAKKKNKKKKNKVHLALLSLHEFIFNSFWIFFLGKATSESNLSKNNRSKSNPTERKIKTSASSSIQTQSK